ncbi:MAG TPA: DUF4404 family protein [Verrucomicrobiae bacterium]|jgi:uncharacterized protein YoxC
MTDTTFKELEAKILALTINEAHQRELLQLLAQLKTEVNEREKQNLTPLKNSVEELRTSVAGFEQSHPKLVQAVNGISNTLSNLGI